MDFISPQLVPRAGTQCIPQRVKEVGNCCQNSKQCCEQEQGGLNSHMADVYLDVTHHQTAILTPERGSGTRLASCKEKHLIHIRSEWIHGKAIHLWCWMGPPIDKKGDQLGSVACWASWCHPQAWKSWRKIARFPLSITRVQSSTWQCLRSMNGVTSH